MTSQVIILTLVCLAVLTNGQGFFGYGPPQFGVQFGGPQGQWYQTYIVQQAANKLSTTELPEDLQQRVESVLTNAEAAFAACDDLLLTSPSIWQHKRCSAFQLKNIMLQLSAIEKEATLRNSTAEPAQVA